jgi:LysR family transcriptional regulator, regulator for metE and metH
MILETRHLRMISAVAEVGTLTKAGQRVYLTQSALSHQLLDLEARLGTPLFYRLGKRMVLTPAGQRVLNAANTALPALQAAEDEVRLIASGRAVILRISTECYTCYHWLPTILRAYNAEFPNVEVQIVATATHHTISSLLEGRIDLGLVHDDIDDDRLTTLDLFDDELLAVVPPDHPLVDREYLDANDFRDQHILVYNLPLQSTSLHRMLLGPAGVTPSRVSEIQLTEAIVEMVKGGHGIAVLARWAVAPHLRAGTLTGVRLTASGLRRRWRAAIVRQEPVPLHLREFARLVAQGPDALRSRDKSRHTA